MANILNQDAPRTTHRKRLALWVALLAALVGAGCMAPVDPTAYLGVQAWLNVAWLFSLTIWLLVELKRPPRLRFNLLVDSLVLAAILWSVVAARLAANTGSPRAASVMFWSWLAVGAAYFFCRQLFQSTAARKAVCVLMVGVAGGLAAAALFDAPFQLPRPGGAAGGFDDFLPSHDEANTAIDVDGMLREFQRDWQSRRVPCRITQLALLGAWTTPCVVLLIGMVLALLRSSRTANLSSLNVARGIAGILLLACISYTTALRLNMALTEADNQVAEAAWKMATTHRWRGVGPGQFADVYTRYRLPAGDFYARTSGNWWLDLRVAAGIPAAALWGLSLLVAGFASVWSAFRGTTISVGRFSTDVNPPQTEMGRDSNGQRHNYVPTSSIMVGTSIGLASSILLNWLVGGSNSIVPALWIVAGSGVACFCLKPWLQNGHLPVALPGLALLTMVGVLTVVGGAEFPLIAVGLMILLAMHVSAFERSADDGSQDASDAANGSSDMIVALKPTNRDQTSRSICTLVMALVALATISSTIAASSVIRSAVFSCQADTALAAGDRVAARERLSAAAAADRKSASAAMRLALFLHGQYQLDGLANHVVDSEAQLEIAVRMAPDCSSVWWVAAQLYCDPDARDLDEIGFRKAVSFGTRALMLDPQRAETSLIVGTAWHRLGQTSRGVEFYEDALAQDAQMRSAGRADLAISDTLRDQLKSWVKQVD